MALGSIFMHILVIKSGPFSTTDPIGISNIIKVCPVVPITSSPMIGSSIIPEPLKTCVSTTCPPEEGPKVIELTSNSGGMINRR